MAKEKPISEQLLALLGPEERARIMARPEFAAIEAQDAFGADLRTIYTTGNAEGTVEGEDTATAAEAERVRAADAERTRAAGIDRVRAAAASNDSPVLQKLNELSTSLDGRFKALEEKVVTTDKLPAMRGEVLAAAIKAADDYAQVRESHRAEFNEAINRDDFEKYVNEQQAAGIRFKDMKSAHDQYVAEKRVAKQIEKGVAEGLKTRKSSEEVPGQTQSANLSPAQQIIASARTKVGGPGKTNAQIAAEKLASMARHRDEGQTVS